jgi:hypothetical protein
LIVRQAEFDGHVLALNISGFFESITELIYDTPVRCGRTGVEKPDHRHCRLLRDRGERPSRRGAEKRNELAPL